MGASISKIRQVSASVMKEVEYLHRVELHEANTRLRNIERDQQRMLLAMEDQKRIMLSLKEERKISTMINDQQTILQAVQSLQMKFSALNAATVVASNEEGPRKGGRKRVKYYYLPNPILLNSPFEYLLLRGW
jgi:predicted GTPase